MKLTPEQVVRYLDTNANNCIDVYGPSSQTAKHYLAMSATVSELIAEVKRFKELQRHVGEYLKYSSVDGVNKRKDMRKKMMELLIP